MNSWRKSLSILTLSGLSALGGVAGYEALRSGNWARAADGVQPAAKVETTPVPNTPRPSASPEAIAKADDLATVFRHVGKQVEPSVVNITVRKTLKARRTPTLPFDDQFRRRFQLPDNGDGNGDEQPNSPFNFGDGDQPQEQVGTGSGVVMQSDGATAYVLTNNHVAGGAEELVVTLGDGRQISKCKVVGADPKTDLAVVKIDGKRLPPAARWGNSDDLEKGDWIMAFGSPFGYVGSMTHGIVSAINRTDVGILGEQGYENFIQVDAPINPGNSGGPLVNLHGDVVGVNTAIASRSGGFQGIGFAIPSNQAKFIYEQLKANGKVVRGWLGVSIADVAKNEEVAQQLGYQGTSGVLVEDAIAKTPAYGKLKSRDIITALNGKPVDNMQQLRNTIASTAPNSALTLSVYRGGKTQDVSIKLGEQPEDVTAASGRPTAPGRANRRENADQPEMSNEVLGMKFMDLTPALARRMNADDLEGGAVVVSVTRKSLGALAGIVQGDVITRVGDSPVKNAKDATELLSKADVNKGLLMDVVHDHVKRLVSIQGKKAED